MRLFKNSSQPKVYRRRILFEQLEERIVLDAAVTPQPTNVLIDHPQPANTQQPDHQDSSAAGYDSTCCRPSGAYNYRQPVKSFITT